ncbi:MAG TPA: ester cyclase [Dehalococcoidia bacterium]|nr:ester cyclase [Dehalococcoidia bacterium]
MSDLAETNKAIVRRALTEILVTENMAVIDELYAPSYVHHAGGDIDRETFRVNEAAFMAAVSESQVEFLNVLGEGEWVAAHYVLSATHTGELAGIPASGKTFSLPIMMHFHVVAGQIAEDWEETNFAGLVAQLI